MAISGIASPVAGTIITTAFVDLNYKTPLQYLLQYFNADPTAANQWLQTDGSGPTATASWVARATAVAAAISGLSSLTLSGNLIFGAIAGLIFRGNAGATPTGMKDIAGQGSVLNAHNDSLEIYDQALAFTAIFQAIRVAGVPTGRIGGQTIWHDGNTTDRVTTAKILNLNVTTGKLADDAVTTVKILDANVTYNKLAANSVDATKFVAGTPIVPSGAVVWFELLAELTAAGAGWARYTAADGRLLVGAGSSASSQTFTQATNYGSDWTPAVGVSVSDTIGVNNGTLATTAGTLGVSIPSAAVSASNGSAGGTSYALGTHGHSGSITGAPALTGAVAKSGGAAIAGTSTVWVPYMRAGIWGRKT